MREVEGGQGYARQTYIADCLLKAPQAHEAAIMELPKAKQAYEAATMERKREAVELLGLEGSEPR